jgi:hypothetical protein
MARDLSKLSVEVCIITEEEMDADPVDPASLDGKTELEPLVDADLDQFAAFYAKTLANSKLSPFERAAIKTYIYWKTHPEVK